ncbi:hypothetical protein Pla110_39550 [Polystyrenella longa]|uniref:Uncharacterized protein n=1 Tax=Polystyrenella longa TaxID=2528007 RepID=A0A518CSL0_9PLAN|nr:hypothetical protein [Polystyrenella longa]QDU82200.1 hypothetical protein Pla110_39550 [Polystyrenella longa]
MTNSLRFSANFLLCLCIAGLSNTLPECLAEETNAPATKQETSQAYPRIAAIVTEYRQNSHADVIVSRLMQTNTLDGKGTKPKLDLVSLWTDQIPENDLSRKLAKEHHVPVYDTIEEALTMGTDKLAVDGILLVAEHGQYEMSATGQIMYPKLRLFKEIEAVFRKTGHVVPVFHDKHISDNWEDAQKIMTGIRELNIPYMAGSSLPVLWRIPEANTKRGEQIKEVVATSYSSLDAYGFHAVEMVHCLIDRRAGGETGVKSVQCLEGDAVWEAMEQGVFDRKLLEECLGRLTKRPPPTIDDVKAQTETPVLFIINYNDGLKASILTLDGSVSEWTVAWRNAETDESTSTAFWTQEARPFMHFTYLLKGAEKMFHTGKPTWNVERTLLVSGTLDALLQSKVAGGKVIETPYLDVTYTPEWEWQQPPPAPVGRPIMNQ